MTVLAAGQAGGILVIFLFLVPTFWVIGKITGAGTCPHCRKGMKMGANVCPHCGRSRR
jgi:predicted amidophosphoribosyltransferase